MGKINILYLIDTIHGVGGTEKHLSQLVTYLDKKKFSCSIVSFFCGKNADAFMNKINHQDVYFEYIPVERFYGIRGFVQALKLHKLIKERNIDIVQTFHFTSDTYGVIVSRLSGVSKIISSRRDTGELKKTYQIMLNKLVNPLITRHIAVADAVADQITKAENISRNHFLTIYNGVELAELENGKISETVRKNLGISNDDFVVGSIAHMRPEKGYDVFIKSIKKLHSEVKNIKGVIVGRVFPGYPEMVKNMGIEDKIIFIGHTDKVKEYISIMDVACLTAVKNEGMSNAILEEMAMGKPVIATTVGGSPELVVDNETGILIPPCDSDILSKAILRLYRDRDLLSMMGRKGRERIEKEFNIKRMIDKMEELYINIYNNQIN